LLQELWVCFSDGGEGKFGQELGGIFIKRIAVCKASVVDGYPGEQL
jgi:hypothetical protein